VAGVTTGAGNGAITLAGTAGNLTLNNAVTAGSGTVALTSAGTITQVNTAPIVAGSLGVRANGTVDLLTAGAPNRVGTLAANDAAPGASVLFGDTFSVAVGTLPASACFAGASGITAPGGVVDLLTAGATEPDPGSVIRAASLRLRGTGT